MIWAAAEKHHRMLTDCRMVLPWAVIRRSLVQWTRDAEAAAVGIAETWEELHTHRPSAWAAAVRPKTRWPEEQTSAVWLQAAHHIQQLGQAQVRLGDVVPKEWQ